MSIDMSDMVRMAGERQREGWEVRYGIRPDKARLMSFSVEGKSESGDLLTAALTQVEADAQFIGQAPATIITLSEQVATLQAQNAALQARVEALGEWQGVEAVPTEVVEYCLLCQTGQGYESYSFGGFEPVYGWHRFAQYGDGSAYPEELDNEASWHWCLIPPPPNITLPDESPTAAE